MIRRKKFKTAPIETYYNKSYEDEAIEFKEPSLTDQSYLMQCDIYTMLEQGRVSARPLEFGEQDYSTREELLNVKLEYQRKWNALDDESQSKFNNNFLDYVSYISNPANYEEALPIEPAPEPVEPAPEFVE